MNVAVVVPVWNGRRWLDGLLASLRAQTRAPAAIIAVDNGSTDGSAEWLREHGVEVIAMGRNTGFAVAANRGIEAAGDADAVALINTDVELEPDWLERLAERMVADERCGAVACKMVDLADPARLYDAGDILRRDGVCEQRGRFRVDDGRWDAPGEVFAACAGAALYRRAAVRDVGGFDGRFFAYMEDVDLGLRLALHGWRCAYEPAVARHAGGGSSDQLAMPVGSLVVRNTVWMAARAFPWRWAPLVGYRLVAWGWHAARAGGGVAYLRALASAVPGLPAMWRERRALRGLPVAIADAVPARPWRGPGAGGHPGAVS